MQTAHLWRDQAYFSTESCFQFSVSGGGKVDNFRNINGSKQIRKATSIKHLTQIQRLLLL